ncbi:hypothetical protein L228DRAFT_268128 [Xylona heveae TC161]|uniref:C2H2-type domain-containing protein n=1 Tax=Xylona heveae (strain CBS 132557 / TC161) TaxID=1328760 RepID=A0A165GXZ6_XYLHT|nr:hypothetical protein L228DRAFT_268128 [Xylona heveae TC161]KZF22744.1 hypothetical protein L228DRAFT_268128 [Xylona heveae TC161]
MSTAYSSHSVQPVNGVPSSASLTGYVSAPQQLMDRGASDYSQSGLRASFPLVSESQSEGSLPDQASAAQYPAGQDVRPSNFSSSATPTSEYGIHPSSARSGSFPEYLTRPQYPEGTARYHPPSNQSASTGGMAQATSPSMPLAADGHTNGHRTTHHVKSDPDLPIDPSIAASSPTYPPPTQYSPYPPQHDMTQPYPAHPAAPQMYHRPEWQYAPAGHAHTLPGGAYGHPSPATTVSAASPAATAGPRPGQVGLAFPDRRYYSNAPQQPHLSQVYSFVPIPGAQQHKRPRRRYEEIERMYKCGWNGCEKAYGTLNHLNAHVTMQSHGQKRTPEEFKEIRKEWKARKKEEENARKAEEERQRQAAAAQATQVDGQAAEASQAPAASTYPPGVRPQLPPIGYAPAGGQVAGQYAAPSGGMDQMHQLYSNYAQSPYTQGSQMYQQR